MPLRRTWSGLAAVTGLLFSLGACGDNNRSARTPTASIATPSTTVDPSLAAKVKVMADYKNFVATRSRGIVTNDPAFSYQQVMTGNALSATKSVATGAHRIGTKYSGSVRFVKGEVVSLDLKAEPATATVQACVFDGLSTTTKSGKVTSSSIEVSREDRMVLVGGIWKATETKSLSKESPGCA